MGIFRRMFRDKKGYPRWKGTKRLVHRTIAEREIRRKLRPHEVVHHNDGNKSNFRKNNLSVMSRSFHSKLENKKRSWWK